MKDNKQKHPGGRPLKFKSVEELGTKIKLYFDSITVDTPRLIIGEDGNTKIPVLNNAGNQIIDKSFLEIPSILGMCIFLEIHRDTLLEYQQKPEFSDAIKAAKLKIERYNADELHRDKNVTGIIFNLKNNFGWVDKSEVDQTNKNFEFVITE